MSLRAEVALGIGVLLGVVGIHAQPAASQALAVASIKPSAPADPTNPRTMFPGVVPEPDGSVHATNAPLVILVRFAYNVEDDQIVGGPGWKLTSRFDITAKAEPGADKGADAVRLRLKALLADRFKLKAHSEIRDMTVSALVLADKTGKLGRDLQPTTAACAGAPSETCRTFVTGQRDANGRLQMLFRGVGQPISALANIVGQAIGRRVIDGTGLTGLYDFETDLPIDPQAAAAGARRAGFVVTPEAIQNLPTDDPAMTTILQQRLGLKLETRKASVPMVVIDSVDLPTPD